MTSYKTDYHLHSRFSSDSETAMEAVCQAAIDRGLREIAFTDHVDFGPADTLRLEPSAYLAEIARCRKIFGDRLTIRAGVEVGEPHLFADKIHSFLGGYDIDFIIGSVHYDIGMRPAWKADYFNQPIEEACTHYFQQVVACARSGDFDSMGHIDLIKRDARKFKKEYGGPQPYRAMIREALELLVKRGKGIEINTSPLGRGQPEPCPGEEILQWYHDLGGEIITIGSDAHTAAAVGGFHDQALALMRSIGFTKLATFEKRKIRWIQI